MVLCAIVLLPLLLLLMMSGSSSASEVNDSGARSYAHFCCPIQFSHYCKLYFQYHSFIQFEINVIYQSVLSACSLHSPLSRSSSLHAHTAISGERAK
jgi:hypothetical protein